MTHEFGGDWTDKKLEVMRRYFSAYARALKNQKFKKYYIDAFAGTGERKDSRTEHLDDEFLSGFELDDINDVKQGSVRIALDIDPPFDRYVFVDLSTQHVSELEDLRSEYRARDIEIRRGNANQVLAELAHSTDWENTRAAIFIDPYGMQVDWSTLRALANTKAVDIALLFPTGALNRMIPRNGQIPAEWERRIDLHLGECDWRTALYQEHQDDDLFSDLSSSVEKVVDAQGLRQYVCDRLGTIFPWVCETQLELKNSKGAVLFHLFIICANPSEKAGKLAMRIAQGAMKPPKKR